MCCLGEPDEGGRISSVFFVREGPEIFTISNACYLLNLDLSYFDPAVLLSSNTRGKSCALCQKVRLQKIEKKETLHVNLMPK